MGFGFLPESSGLITGIVREKVGLAIVAGAGMAGAMREAV